MGHKLIDQLIDLVRENSLGAMPHKRKVLIKTFPPHCANDQ